MQSTRSFSVPNTPETQLHAETASAAFGTVRLMQRRAFLSGLGWAAAGLALGACGKGGSSSPVSSASSTAATAPLLDGVSLDVHRDPG